MNNLKEKFSDYKAYFKVITDFSSLNNYVFYSSIFLNRLENIIYSDILSDEEKLNNIILAFSDFKVTNLEENFSNEVHINNNFEN